MGHTHVQQKSGRTRDTLPPKSDGAKHAVT
jgi:hypothetical protein